MKKEKGISLVLLIVFIILLFVIVGVVCYNIFSSDEENNAEVTNDNEIENNEISSIDIKTNDINDWNGIYSNDSDVVINIYRYSDNQFSFEVMNENYSASYQIDLDSDNKATYSGEWFDETYSINVIKNGDEITIESSTTEEDGILNKVDGTYTKEEFENYGWSGKYISGDHVIILSECSEERLYISIDDYYQLGADDYNEEEIEYESDFFDEETSIKIEKTTDGIKVESSSSDEEDILNEISGEFEKID